MILEHSGWEVNRGFYTDKYYFDETKTGHKIHWRNGAVCRQQSSFEMVTADWNNDGDVYSEFGANFDSQWGAGREWWTPQNLLGIMLDGEATIPGIKKI